MQNDKQKDEYIKMLNDSSIMSSSFGAVMSKKGFGSFKRFQGRLKHKIANIGIEFEEKKMPTVWDNLRRKE